MACKFAGEHVEGCSGITCGLDGGICFNSDKDDLVKCCPTMKWKGKAPPS